MKTLKITSYRYWYLKLLDYCNSKWATTALVFFTFIESSVFVIPPETFLLPMCYANRKRAYYLAFITTIASVAGAVLGYYIGKFFWAELGPWIMAHVPGIASNFDQVGSLYESNAVLTIFTAAFTPIPYKVFTIAAGVYSDHISLWLLVVVSLFGRGVRYFLLAGLVYYLGPYAKKIIEKYFTIFTIAFTLLTVILVMLYRYLL